MGKRFLWGLGGALVWGLSLGGAEPRVEPLWPTGGVPDALETGKNDNPTLTVYEPSAEKRVGAAVIICPGGGYGGLAVDKEGVKPALFFNELGVTAFVLRYRLSPYRHPIPLGDAQRAIRLVRARGAGWGVDPARVGIMGFSAGGHLSATAAVYFDDGKPEATDLVERQSCRPDFAVLCYPVISMTTEYTHTGSRRNLLGKDHPLAMRELVSVEKHVTPQTPPTFLFHTDGDRGVVPENSVLFYLALRRAKVPAELHIYETGPHGVGLYPKDEVLATWPGRLAGWLKTRGLLKRKDG